MRTDCVRRRSVYPPDRTDDVTVLLSRRGVLLCPLSGRVRRATEVFRQRTMSLDEKLLGKTTVINITAWITTTPSLSEAFVIIFIQQAVLVMYN